MDEQRAQRIEQLLLELVRDQLPRAEFDTRFTRLENRVGRALDRIAVVETKIESVSDLGERMNDVEDVASTTRSRERRRGVLVPTLVTAAGIVVNALLAAVTWFAGGHSHHG